MKYLVIFLVAVSACTAISVFGQTSVSNGQRIVRSINQDWRFSPTDQKGFEGRDVSDASWQRVNIPHTWNDEDVFDETPAYRRGASWYRRGLTIGSDLKGKRSFLYFEGANQVAEVFVNGRLAGKHIGGYTAFVFDITGLVEAGKPNVLAVRVDNSFSEDIPPLTGDFNMYGGIYRDVWLIAASDVHFKIDDLASSGVQISTPEISAGSGTVRIRGIVKNTGGRVRKLSVRSRVLNAAGQQVASAVSSVDAAANSDAAFDLTTPKIANPRLWSPDDPYLYRVENTIADNGRIVDVVTQPLGFRWFSFDADKGFFLNGNPLKLRGTNRHQDYKGFGNAVPDRLQVRDLELIKDAGFNFLRLAHYPQDPSVLHAADRLGLLIWEEIPLVNYITESKAFAYNSLTMLKEMIRQHRNHPSVIMWGYMNEIFLPPTAAPESVFPATVQLARDLDAVARLEDPTRVTTIAFHGNDVYNKWGLGEIPQVVGWNLYKGWYSGGLEDFGKFMDEQHRRFPKRVHIVSEYGANGDQRLHSAEPRRFDSTIEYQRMFHESHLAQIDARPYIAGSTIWNQFDFGAELRGETIPHLNQKGMFTFDRKPKDIHFFYKASLSSQPVIHIAVSDQKHFAGEPGELRKIDVYSNLPDAELFCNGVSLGVKTIGGSRKATWDVRFKNGLNTLQAKGKRDGRPLSDSAEIQFQAVTVNSREIAINLGSNADFTDRNGLVWLSDQPYRKGGWGFTGERTKRIYSAPPDRDILGTDDDPLFQTMLGGLETYRLDVPDGEYELELLFAETKLTAAGQRVFDVVVNGSKVIEKLDLAGQTGIHRAFTKRITVRAAGGIAIEFTPLTDEPILSGIRLLRSR